MQIVRIARAPTKRDIEWPGEALQVVFSTEPVAKPLYSISLVRIGETSALDIPICQVLRESRRESKVACLAVMCFMDAI